MKKFGFAIFCVLAGLLFFSCTNSLEDRKSSGEYGSVSLGNDARAIFANDITSCIVSVSGTGISSGSEPTTTATVSNGIASGVTVDKIPVGKNRVVTVQAYNADGKINGIIMRAICDITAGSNTAVTVNWETTKIGNVFASLLSSNKSLLDISSDDITKIKAAFPDVTAPYINTNQIASDYISGGASGLQSSENYKLSAATVTLNTTKLSKYKVYIGDPASSIQTISDTTSTGTFEVAPGTWPIYAVDSKDKVQKQTYGTFASGNTYTVDVTNVPAGSNSGVDLTDKTIIFVKASSAPTIWAWEDNGVALSESLGESWSGNSMTAATSDYMTDYSGWYYKDFSSVATGKTIKFKVNSGDEITGEAGTFWYDGSSCTTTNPSPISSSTTEDSVTITVTQTGNNNGGNNNDNNDDDNDSEYTSSIMVHAKYPYIYIWNSGITTIDETTQPMTSEGNDWYYYEIGATSASIIFKQYSDDWTGKTDDLSRTEAGEYWYYEGSWYEGNPEDSEAPELTSFTSNASGTVTGTVTLTATATDNTNLKNVTFSLSDGTVIAVVDASGTSATVTYNWDTTKVQNETYTVSAVANDAAKNSSSAKTISITTSNANLPPVAVISGSTSAKVGASKTYDASSSYDQNGGTIASYSWSVSGGATIVGGTTSKTLTLTMPSSATTVTVSLTVKDNDGASSDTVSKSVTVKEASTESEDFRDETIYFLITTRFYDGDSSNNVYCWDEDSSMTITDGDPGWRGDFEGLIDKLDYIKALGFSAIWITPVVENASGLDYHGYHAFDFSQVDPRYAANGYTAEESYQRLIDACHEKGIKVIQDIVLNHTGNWGERNLYPMFKKGDTYTSNGYLRAQTMVENDTNGYLAAGATMAGGTYAELVASSQYSARINAMKTDSIDSNYIYHHDASASWSSYAVQTMQIAGDCVDLNTENPNVMNYLIKCYEKYIDMGVDSFRVDTVKHISRYTLNNTFNTAIKEYAGDDFYMFGEVCARYRGEWNEGVPAISPCFYQWKETDSQYQTWSSDWSTNYETAGKHFTQYSTSFTAPISSSSANYLLINNTYRKPDYTLRSGMDTIDFYMHWAFNSVNDAFSTGLSYDKDYCDPTWLVTYVDSHDYAPDNAPENQRYTGYWPDKLNLMFTFRGIPCIYYGSEIEFKKGMSIDPASNKTKFENSGRAYYGDYLEGSVTATDYGEYTASGTVANTLSGDLAQHIIRLNKIRRAIPALRKGQYSTENCSGSIAFKRRYTDDDVDSFALVTINGAATFSGLPAGTYVEVITGNSVNVSEGGSITTDSIGEGNMRVYVNTSLNGCEVTGKIGNDGAYLN